MIGKYLGALLPTIFGFYGLVHLYGEYTQSLALIYVLQMAIVLYPPFVTFTVFHNRYVKTREALLLERLKVTSHKLIGDKV